MAQSSCVKCASTSFEIKELKVSGSNFRLYAVQCSRCGGVVGIQEFSNITAMLASQNKAIKAIAAHMGISVSLTT